MTGDDAAAARLLFTGRIDRRLTLGVLGFALPPLAFAFLGPALAAFGITYAVTNIALLLLDQFVLPSARRSSVSFVDPSITIAAMPNGGIGVLLSARF
jgi:hypothetical protein